MLALRRGSVLATCLLVIAGCSTIINPDSNRLGSDGDASMGTRDAGRPGFDAGPGIDAGECTEGRRRCAGDQLLTCVAGLEVASDCQSMSAFCQGDVCQPHVCTPNSRSCSRDGSSLVECSARGDRADMTACEGGCDPDSFSCRDVSACEDFPRIPVGGTRRVNLCNFEDANTFNRSDGCMTDLRAASPDQTFVLTIPSMQRVTISLTDVDDSATVDTVFYVRRICGDASTQIGCADDVPCAASTATPPACFTGGVDVRQSRVTATLPPGTYYIVADAYDYRRDGTTFGCGRVELEVRDGGSVIDPGDG